MAPTIDPDAGAVATVGTAADAVRNSCGVDGTALVCAADGASCALGLGRATVIDTSAAVPITAHCCWSFRGRGGAPGPAAGIANAGGLLAIWLAALGAICWAALVSAAGLPLRRDLSGGAAAAAGRGWTRALLLVCLLGGLGGANGQCVLHPAHTHVAPALSVLPCFL